MRALLVGLAALFAFAMPGLAAADTGGHIKLTYASIDGYDDNYDDCECYFFESDNTVVLSGAVVTDINDQWRVQFNGASADTETNYYNSYQYSDAHSQVEVHATYTTGMWDVGGFTGMFNNNGYSFYEYGVEAAANFDRGEIAVSVAGATSPNTDFADDVQTVAATGTFNLTEHISIGATLSNTNFGGWGSSDDVEVRSYGVNVAYHIPNTDFTVAVGYRSSDVDYGDNYYYYNGSENDISFIGASVAWSFGEGRGREMPGAAALIPDAIAAMSNVIS
jgi:hypothetical protein